MITMCRVNSHSSYNLLFSEKIQLHFILVLWRVIGHPYIESATALYDIESATTLSDNNREEEESNNLPACHISETVSSLVLKLDLHIVVGSSRLDNHSQ